MPTHYDKLLITHGGALRRKYAASGAAAVRDALDALVAADRERDLVSRVLLLDNAQSMRAVSSTKVADGDWVATLRAVDRAAARYQPAYIALVGATDVVPQARVGNPMGTGRDPDPYLPSDLPFACDLPESWSGPQGDVLEAAELLSVTRVVGRIPDLVGASEPAMLLAALRTAATATRRKATAYQKVFSLSAAVWKGSTVLSVDQLPGPSPTTHLSPTDRSPWAKAQLAPLTHFVNCHGGDTTPDWFGQARGGAVDTVALAPEDVDGRIAAGTVVASECCYGAMHMDPADIGDRVPLLWAYLRSGAYAGIGSSTTAYGPADGMGLADLVCRYALEGILAGASSGRALLDARQRFIRETGSLTPVDLKTLAQFDLLGDPSLVPVDLPGTAVPKSVTGDTTGADGSPAARSRVSLTQRRRVLAASGRALAGSVPRAGRRKRATVDAVVLAGEAGLRASDVVGEVESFGEHGEAPRAGLTYHLLPVRSGGREGFVVSREAEGYRQSQAVWRK
jgi:hypothetical protein